MILKILAAALVLFATAFPSAYAQQILLWPNGAPGALGNRPEDKPTLTPFVNVSAATGSAIIVCPGGGYVNLAAHEGAPVAEWLNSIGVKAFVLKYRLGSNGYRYPAPLQDAQRAIRYVRAHAAQYGIDPNRIGIMGFSAGGHVASLAGTHVAPADPNAADPLDRVSSRPNLMILIYPVITMGKYTHMGSRENLLGKNPPQSLVDLTSNEKQVTADTPSTFLVQGENDPVVPVENSLLFAEALRRAGVGFELHIFQKSPGHGFGLAPNDPIVSIWPKLCEHWLRSQGF